MKTLILLSLLASGSALACQCSYDWDDMGPGLENRIVKLTGAAKAKDIKVEYYEVKYTPMSYVDPTSYGSRSCGCTSFVKQVWDITYPKGEKSCKAQIVFNVWNEKLKAKNIACN